MRASRSFILCLFFAIAALAKGDDAHPLPLPGEEYGESMPYERVKDSTGSIAVEMEGGRLYALSGNGLKIYTLEHPAAPKLVGSVTGLGSVRQLAVRGNTAYVTARQDGLWIIDVSRPNAPAVLSQFDTIEYATGLDVAGEVAFVGERIYGVEVIDVSDRRNPKHVSSYRTSESQSVRYDDSVLFSGDWALGEITILDASDLLNLKPLAIAKLDGYGDGVFVAGRRLFAATGHHAKSGPADQREGNGHGLEIFDISTAAKPKKLSTAKFPKFFAENGADFWMPRAVGNSCFVADTTNGVFHLDVSDLKHPKIVGRLRLPVPPGKTMPDAVGGVAIGDGVLYVAGLSTGLYVASGIKTARAVPRRWGRLPRLPGKPADFTEDGFIAAGASTRAPVRAVAIRGDTAYAACSTDGLKIFQLSDRALTERACLGLGSVYDVRIRGEYLYAAEGLKGFAIYRIEGSAALREVGRLSLGNARYVYAPEGTDIVMVTPGNSMMFFINASDARHPKLVRRDAGRQMLYGNYATAQLALGRYAACARHCGGFMLYDLSGNTPRLVLRDTYPLCTQDGGTAVFRDKILVMKRGGYALVDPEKPATIESWPRRPFPDDPQASDPPAVIGSDPASRATFPKSEYEGLPSVDGSIVAVSSRLFKRCGLYDFSDPANPRFLHAYTFKNHQNVPSFWQGRLVFPAGYSGLLLERKSMMLKRRK